MESFEVKEGNTIIDNLYLQGNYYEEQIDINKKVCLIFFSSNGIYYPDTKETFEREIIKKDRYEWINMSRDKRVRAIAGKLIFVRDIYKSWYVTGINSHLNSVDALTDFLREKTRGYNIITAGNSAGGYAAALFGIMLEADMALSWGGQFSLYKFDHSVEKNIQLSKYVHDAAKEKYYDIELLVHNSSMPIYYFYAADCQLDLEQFEHINKDSNVYGFAFKSKKHGDTMYPRNMPYILSLPQTELHKLYTRYQGCAINKNEFYIYCLGLFSYLRTIFLMIINKFKKQIHAGYK